MKQYLLTTPLGCSFIALRDRLAATWATWEQDETATCRASDALATRLVTRLCKPGTVFIDVGAHIGSVIAQVMHFCPSVRIEAIEASPEKCASLARRFPNVKLHAVAVGDTDDKFIEYFHFPERSGYNTTVRPRDADAAGAIVSQVPVRRLDSLVAPENVDLVKIDVEGAEAAVIEGSTRILETSRPTVMFESTPEPESGIVSRATRLFELLDGHGYVILLPDRVGHRDTGLCLSSFIDCHLFPRRSTNFFAVAKERRAELRDRTRQLLRLT